MFEILLTILIAVAAFFAGVMWERYQRVAFVNEEIFDYHDDLGV